MCGPIVPGICFVKAIRNKIGQYIQIEGKFWYCTGLRQLRVFFLKVFVEQWIYLICSKTRIFLNRIIYFLRNFPLLFPLIQHFKKKYKICKIIWQLEFTNSAFVIKFVYKNHKIYCLTNFYVKKHLNSAFLNEIYL